MDNQSIVETPLADSSAGTVTSVASANGSITVTNPTSTVDLAVVKSPALSISGQTGLLTVTGLLSTNRIKTVRDAADTILELGGSYTPTGNWTNMQLITPTLGVASATTVNKVALTAPATGSTLTIADGKTLTASNSITLAGTDSTTMTFPWASANIGYLEVPSNSQSADYGIVLADSGKSIDHPASDANARTFTIPANGTIPFPVGACLTFTNMTANVVSIAITSDTMYLAWPGTTGTRSLAQYGVATARKLTSTTWLISGTGLT